MNYILYGLKINLSDLEDRGLTIEDIYGPSYWNLTAHFVVGLDRQLATENKPHYHLHWKDTRTLEALRKFKQKVMPNWGHCTKLYVAKTKDASEKADPLAWLGYACKENLIFASDDIDRVALEKHAHTMAEFKKSQLKWGAKKELKKEEASTLEQRIFSKIDAHPPDTNPYEPYFIYLTHVLVSKYYYAETEEACPARLLQKYTYKYLFSKKYLTHEDYVKQIIRINT